ncbi:MAG: 2-keto-3-deoxygluconate permease [Clostridium sp.]
MTVAVTGILTFIIYSLIRRKADPMGAAIGTVAGVAATTPAAIADADPSLLRRLRLQVRRLRQQPL